VPRSGTVLENDVVALDSDIDVDTLVEKVTTKLERLHELIKDMRNLQACQQILDEFNLVE
jgi:hypothetical protein